MQKIRIKNFGPIEELNLDIKDFILLIGTQASGKSTVAKTIFFFKSLKSDWIKYFAEAIDKNDFTNPLESLSKKIRQKFIEYFGINNARSSLYLEYSYSRLIYINITLGEHGYIELRFSEQLKKETERSIQESKALLKKLIRMEDPSLLTSKELLQNETERQKFIEYLTVWWSENVFEENKEMIFIPAGRSLLATFYSN
jgi:AAA15 family ATPase/GTPase